MPGDQTHARRVQEVFARQAAAFEDRRHNHALTHDSQWLFQSLRVEPQDLLLDVAAGTGHAARSLAHRVRVAVALDLTEQMLHAGKRAAEQQGLSNVVFQRGDALRLPFLDESFDVVISRFASHHIERPDVQIAEMARVLRSGGRLGLADVVADEDPAVARTQGRLERMRDPSHTRTLPISEIVAEMQSLGLEAITVESRAVEQPVDPWLQRAGTPTEIADSVRAELKAEIAGGAPTGLRPVQREGELWLAQVWACVTAVKPAA
jgi:ubiquinone/menaquinone biosynthesis C-methylase UbiE